MLTYPRTDSRALPEDYLPVVRQTLGNLSGRYNRMLRRRSRTITCGSTSGIFNNAKSATTSPIIPTASEAKNLDDAEAKFTTWSRAASLPRLSSGGIRCHDAVSRVAAHKFKTEGKVMTSAGWLEVYGRVQWMKIQRRASIAGP